MIQQCYKYERITAEGEFPQRAYRMERGVSAVCGPTIRKVNRRFICSPQDCSILLVSSLTSLLTQMWE